MDYEKLLSAVDHTLLTQTATWADIEQICDDGVQYKTASICIPPSFVAKASKYVEGKVAICTVIGFPNGYSTTKTKVFETENAILNGADEIDMVINLGWLKEHEYRLIKEEINEVKKACKGRILKVIIETCLLNTEEKIDMCKTISDSNADFIKTSTGFSTAGATIDDIKLFKENVSEHIKIKAAGGISSLQDAEEFLNLGADRLGTSRIVKIIKNLQKENRNG